MIRVAYDYQAFAWQHVGGITRYLCELATRVDNIAGFRADIVAPVHFNSYLRSGTGRVYGAYVPPLPRTGNIIRAVNSAVTPLALRMLKPDILHETYYRTGRLAPARTPTVLTVYDMIHEKLPHAFRADDPTSSHKRSAVMRADHVICISENTRRDLVDLFDVPEAKTSVIHLGFSFTTPGAEKNGVAPQGVERPYILYVGHRGGWKNYRGILDAYASSAKLRGNFSLVVFGGGAFAPQERKRIEELGITDGKVRQVSGSDAVLEWLYRNASLFVYPSMYEGFGLPPLEAMSLDCPVACSNTSSIPEVVGDAARLFEPADIGSIRAAIEDVVESEGVRTGLIERGRERVKRFSWDKCASETMSVYRRLAS